MGNTTRASDCRSAAWALASVAATVLTASLICEDASAAPKTDIVEFTNGDTLTGEVKGLQQGILTFKTDMMSTVSIKWEYVRNLKTSQYLEVENTEGSRYYGQGPEFADPEAVRLVYGESVSVLPLGDVVRERVREDLAEPPRRVSVQVVEIEPARDVEERRVHALDLGLVIAV